jgi:hypothetical protein
VRRLCRELLPAARCLALPHLSSAQPRPLRALPA